ncbi:hypothetical protein [Solibacillus cecembensis]
MSNLEVIIQIPNAEKKHYAKDVMLTDFAKAIIPIVEKINCR